NTNNDFLLSYSGIKAASGIEISGQELTISYQLDTTPPTIKKVELLTYNEIEVTFSELLATSSLNNFSHNFTIESPFAGLQIIVENAVLQDSVITLTLSNNLINTIKPYWVRMDNVFDLAGNKIQNNDLRHCLYLTEITNLSFVETYPNPLRLKDIKEVTFVNLPVKDSGEIMIYNLAGELVYNHKLSNCSEFAWDGKNNSQKAVASGIYTYLIKMGNDYKKGKLVLIK
ncbi:MAG TPA: gliding motility-associated C-terminal domain-containing protein, partial [Candidatus Cloacimonadota bacterium]|nr:gliding motility-associated C-terminal domain-containing protein [Candidatus Cloacimonadota bacterium]